MLAALAAVLFVLLGSAGSALDPIAQAATLSAQAPGYRMHMTMRVSTPVIAMTGEAQGVVDLRDHASSMSMVMHLPDLPQVTQALGGSALTLDMVMERAIVYFKFPPGLASRLPYSKPWLKLDLGRVLSSAGLSGVTSLMNNPMTSDPTSQLAYLRATSGDVVNEGQQVVDGVMTTHYRADIDYGRVANAVPPAEQPATRAAMSKLESLLHTNQEPVDVWIDHSHHVRRMAVTISYTLNGMAMGESFTADMSDYGPQPAPAAPPASEVQDLTGMVGL